ncbi:MAG: hypothetical protein ABSF45_12695 [Terriglobia bacterium]|jgi:hypothetical protein
MREANFLDQQNISSSLNSIGYESAASSRKHDGLKMLKMKDDPQILMKTKGQENRSSEFIENEMVIIFSSLLHDI